MKILNKLVLVVHVQKSLDSARNFWDLGGGWFPDFQNSRVPFVMGEDDYSGWLRLETPLCPGWYDFNVCLCVYHWLLSSWLMMSYP